MQKSINDILKENKKLIEKQQEENKKAISLFKKVFNTEDGEKVLEYLEKYVKKPTDLNNPNANYYRDGGIDLINFINKIRKM